MATPTRARVGTGLDLHARRKDGSEFPVEVSLSPLETEGGTLVTAAMRDITERRKRRPGCAHLAATRRVLGRGDHRRGRSTAGS